MDQQHQQKVPFHQQLQQQQQPQQQQQQQQQQQLLLLQQLQKQALQQQQAAVISRFPSNIDAHLRTPGLPHRPPVFQNPNPSSNSSSNPNSNSIPTINPNIGLNPNPLSNSSAMHQQVQQHQQQASVGASSVISQNPQSLQPQKVSGGGMMMMRPHPVNQAELQMAYQGAWQVCHPDFKRPFASLEDACERLLAYHVVADYEAEEDDRILDSDTTGQMPSRSQQWDHNIAAKVAEFTGTFEKQALAFNIITRKRALGEFRSEERLMIEQALLQEEKRLLLEKKAEIDAREKAGREAQFRMAAMVQAEHARVESQAHSEMMARGPIRTNAFGSQSINMGMAHGMPEQQHDHAINPEEMMNGWGNTNQHRDEKEPSDDFLNDDDNENGDVGVPNEWRGVGEFDLNSR